MYDDRATLPQGSGLRESTEHATRLRPRDFWKSRNGPDGPEELEAYRTIRIRIARGVTIRKRAGRQFSSTSGNALSCINIPLNRFKRWVQV